MDGRRTALIVASDEFEHAGLSRLQAPSADAEALAEVLGDPDIGGFAVRVVHNSPSHTVQAQVEDLFAEGRPEDLLLLHFSGHGLKSDSGELFFAATNTRPDRLASTAVSADFVQRCMRGSRARSIVLFLDCCYGGAFGEGVAVRAAGPANVLDSFPAGKLGGGRGRAVITASSAMEYAFEGSALATDDQRQPSVFTAAVVEGLTSGAADRDEDGLVSLNELYDYVFDQVRAQNPNQTPSRDMELQGELYVAKSRRKRTRAVPLPPDLRAAVQDDNMYTRLGAVGELRARLASADAGVALGAREALDEVARSDTSYVAEAAKDALAVAPTTTAPSPAPAAPAALVTMPSSAPDALDATSTSSPAIAVPTSVADEVASSVTEPAAAPVSGPPAAPVSEPPAAPVSEPPTAPVAEAGAPPTASSTTAATRTAAPEPNGEPTSPGHRVPAGRTTLTGGSLVLLSALLPEFVYANGVFEFQSWLGVVLVVVGGATLAVGLATLLLPWLRGLWPWMVLGAAAAAVVTLVALLDATAALAAYDIHLGVWVALGGCLTVVAAGVVAVTGLRRRQDSGSTAAERPAQSALTTAVGQGSLVAAGTMVAATFAVRFVNDAQALVDPDRVWSWLFPAWVALAAGILTLRLRRWPQVGPALLVGSAASAIWGLWELPRIWSAVGTSSLESGFYLELVGVVALVVLGVAAVVLLRGEHAMVLGRPDRRTLVLVTTCAVVSAVPFVLVAQWNWENSETGNTVHDAQMAVFAVAVPLLAVLLRPAHIARFVLMGWSVGAVGTVVAYWRLLRPDSDPLFGIPYVLITLGALVVIALTIRPPQRAD